ncbi:uncharacterized protein BDZ83DRAFT_652351 [Colletotrichum acutatum]|uniref:Uncharacterized protein n=1 Tax=Glomerella acutata TaxID=27357 RepID=A0AAD8UPV2_GLOAC|nr:uncharacterized protein BDZ83DRAFT_652351 [Colletotrichum acutatum]KAK1724270.1 hypothetical protein BDZ83DRAFT_652351 [Colletotrichum acutatum]
MKMKEMRPSIRPALDDMHIRICSACPLESTATCITAQANQLPPGFFQGIAHPVTAVHSNRFPRATHASFPPGQWIPRTGQLRKSCPPFNALSYQPTSGQLPPPDIIKPGKASMVGTVEHLETNKTWAGVIAKTQDTSEQNPMTRSAGSGIRYLEYGKMSPSKKICLLRGHSRRASDGRRTRRANPVAQSTGALADGRQQWQMLSKQSIPCLVEVVDFVDI